MDGSIITVITLTLFNSVYIMMEKFLQFPWSATVTFHWNKVTQLELFLSVSQTLYHEPSKQNSGILAKWSCSISFSYLTRHTFACLSSASTTRIDSANLNQLTLHIISLVNLDCFFVPICFALLNTRTASEVKWCRKSFGNIF